MNNLDPIMQAAIAPFAPKEDVIYSANGWPFPARPDPAIEECEHDWKLIHDYEGDPGVINGTHSFSYLECRTCGEQCNDSKLIQDYEDSATYDD